MKFTISTLMKVLCATAACFLPVFSEEFLTSTQVHIQEFKCVGNERLIPYDQFKGLPEGICSTLKSLHLEYLEFDPNVLIESLEGCNNLESITLFYVEWISPVRNKVILPNLKRFNVTMYHIEANTGDEFLKPLFFVKNQTAVPTTVSIILNSDMDGQTMGYNSSNGYLLLESMRYDVAKYFNYNQVWFENSSIEPKWLKVENLTHVWSNVDHPHLQVEILEAFKPATRLDTLNMVLQKEEITSVPKVVIDLSLFASKENFNRLGLVYSHVWSSKLINLQRLRTLQLIDCEFNTTLISVPSSLQYLYLLHVGLTGVPLDTFLNGMNNLKMLSIQFHNKIFVQKVDLVDLKASAETLEKIWLEGVHLVSSVIVEFKKLKYFSLRKCELDRSDVASNFNEIFPNLSDIYLYKSNLSFSLFRRILSISSLQSITIIPNNMEVSEITGFLQDSGVPSGVNVAVLGRSMNSSTGWLYLSALGQYNTKMGDFVLYTYIFVLMTICGGGILGNVMSGVVLTRKSMWGSTSCILLGLCICDSLLLTTYLSSILYFGIKLILVFLKFRLSPDLEIYTILGFEVNELSIKRLDEFQYILLYPLNKTAYTGSVYTTVLLTIERYIAVCWPLHANRLLRTRTAVYSLLLILSFSLLINFPRWIEAQQYSSTVSFAKTHNEYFHVKLRSLVFKRKTFASGLLRSRYYRQYYHGFIWIISMYLLPITGLTFLNFKILKQLKQSNQNREALATTQQNSSRRTSQAVQLASLTRMLLCVIMIFVLCNSASGLIVWILLWYGSWEPTDIEIFSCIPLIINSSVNFVIYVLLGSKFRAELTKIFTNCWWKVICQNQTDHLRAPAAGNNIPLARVTSSTSHNN